MIDVLLERIRELDGPEPWAFEARLSLWERGVAPLLTAWFHWELDRHPQKAAEVARLFRALAPNAPSPRFQAECARVSGIMAQSEGRYAEALADLEAARTGFETLSDAAEAHRTQVWALMPLLKTGRTDAALALDRKLDEAFRSIPRSLDAARLCLQNASLRKALGDPASAKNLLKAALEVFERCKETEDTAKTEAQLAHLAVAAKDFAEAHRLLAKALPEVKKLGLERLEAGLHKLAYPLALQQGFLMRAERSLAAVKASGAFPLPESLRIEAQMAAELGAVDEVLRLCEELLAEGTATEEQTAWARNTRDLALAGLLPAEALSEPWGEGASAAFAQAWYLTAAVNVARQGRGEVLAELKRRREALDFPMAAAERLRWQALERAFSIGQESFSKDAIDSSVKLSEAFSHYSNGLQLRQEGRFAEARKCFEKAGETGAGLALPALTHPEWTVPAGPAFLPAWEEWFDTLMEEGTGAALQEGLEAWETRRLRAWARLARQRWVEDAPLAGQKAAGCAERLRLARERLGKASAQAPGATVPDGTVAKEIESAWSELAVLTGFPANDLLTGKAFPLGEVQKKMAPGTLLLSFALVRGHWSGFAVTAEQFQGAPRYLSGVAVAELLENWENELAQGRLGSAYVEAHLDQLCWSAEAVLEDFGEQLLGPFRELIAQAERVVIVPGPAGSAIPFSLLRLGGRELAEWKPLTFSLGWGPEALFAQLDTRLKGNGLTLFGGASQTASALEGKGAVLDAAAELATALSEALPRYGNLHLSAQCRLASPSNSVEPPPGSWFATFLAGEEALPVHRIPRHAGNGRVVLPSLGVHRRPGEALGSSLEALVGAFRYAGFRDVVLTQWVREESSYSDFYKEFYKLIRAESGTLEALRKAQEKSRKMQRHPFFYGADQLFSPLY